MPYVLGIDIRAGSTVAAVSWLQHSTWRPPELVTLGTRSIALPSTLRLTPDGLVAGVDGTGPDIVRGFLQRIGDDVPLVVDGRPHRAAALTTALVDQVIGRVEAAEGGPAERIVVPVPGTWGPYRTGLLHDALGRVGLGGVALPPAPIAAVEGYAAREPLDVGDTVAVYDLGPTGCECALVRRTGPAAFELLACAETGVPIGGADFDDALVAGVRARLDDHDDPADPQARLALAALRQRCAAAREELSGAASTTVRALLPGGQRTVTVSLEEFEELIQPLVSSTVDTLRAVLRSGPAPVAVLLVGGAARTPLVRRQVESAVPGPVWTADDPGYHVALGAACAAQRLLARPDSMVAYRPAAEDGRGAVYGVSAESGVEDPGDPGTEPAYPPPRPPVVITALGAPRRRSGRRVASDLGAGTRLVLAGLALLVIVVGVWLTLVSGRV
jgi:molecular chaperone DnaK (HSP70)